LFWRDEESNSNDDDDEAQQAFKPERVSSSWRAGQFDQRRAGGASHARTTDTSLEMTASIDGVRGADPPSSGAAAAAGASAPDPAASSDARSKEQQAKKIRADRSAEDPQQSLLDALGDYMVLCGGDPLEDVRPDPARLPSPPRAASPAPRRGHPPRRRPRAAPPPTASRGGCPLSASPIAALAPRPRAR